MKKAHIMVVDDHQDIRDLLAEYLNRQGYQVTTAGDGAAMRDLLTSESLEQGTFDLIILDVMMPGEDGLSLCQHVRAINGPSVIMLTAMNDDADCVVGLELGADDYVTKPFSPRVLLARIKSVLRRVRENGFVTEAKFQSGVSSNNSTYLAFMGWRLDVLQRQLMADDGVLISLSNAEFVLLEVFLKHPQRVLSRDQLLSLTKGREAEPFDRSVDNQVSRLRKKLEADPQNPTLIKTVWGGGYMFAAAVTSVGG
jgi:two-component system OmpR family response regulator